MADAQPEITSRLLQALPPDTLARLKPHLEFVETERGQVIEQVSQPVDHMYFVNRGLISLVKSMEDGDVVEIGAVGVEGITDAAAVFGIEAALLETVVQIPGSAWRIRRERLMAESEKDGALRELMRRYLRFAFLQLAQTAACNRLHFLEERCCRWLLIAHDSALADTFPLTHEFLAMMLGVQRAGVTVAANSFRKAGLIDYRRGRMTILDRRGLEEVSCECYRMVQHEMARLFPTRSEQR